MADSRRITYKKKLNQVSFHINVIVGLCIEIGSTYVDAKPELSDYLLQLHDMLVEVNKIVEEQERNL